MSGELAGRVRGLTWLSALGALALAGFYAVLVRTPIGQRWDDRGLLGGLVGSLGQRQRLTTILHEIRISTLVLMVVLLLVIGLLRRRFATSLIAAVAFGGAVLSAEVLKRVLPRHDLAPELNSYVDNGNIDTYPSGHATIAMAFALALILVSSARVRMPVAIFGMAWAAGISMAALAAGWHRPSDIAGGAALGVMWLAGASALSARWFGRVQVTPANMRWLLAGAVGALTLLLALLALWVLRGNPDDVPVGGALPAFLLAEAGVAVLAIAAVALFAFLTRGLSFDKASGTGDPASA